MPRLVFLVALLCCVPLRLLAQERRLFEIDGGSPVRTRVLFTGEGLDGAAAGAGSTPMLERLRGVAVELVPRDLAALKACISTREARQPSGPDAAVRDGERLLYVLDAEGRRGTHARYDIVRQTDATLALVERSTLSDDAECGRRYRFKIGEFEEVARNWPRYRGKFDLREVGRGEATIWRLEQPYTAGDFVLDERTLAQRFGGGSSTGLDGTARLLSEEAMFVRLPKGYDPRIAHGLIVWIDPSPSGEPPEFLNQAADSLGLICIGAADCGNDRALVDRSQLALDAAATAQERFHVDRARVYAAGLSGGGRVSSILVGCFPDIFFGAAPIVGVSSYRDVPAGARGVWRAAYRRPSPKIWSLFKLRRIGAVTGSKDFNHESVVAETTVMEIDGLAVRLFDYPGMGHEPPTPESFVDVMTWIDEPARGRRDAAEAAAAKAMTEVAESEAAVPALPADRKRARLLEVTREWPFTRAAWDAAAMLEPHSPMP